MARKQTTPLKEKIISTTLIVLLAVFVLHLVGQGFFRPHRAKKVASKQMLPPGWSAAEPWEVYPNGRLYEKIDGREPLFQQYGVVQLRYAAVSKDKNDFEVYLYDMQTPDGALGIYLANSPSEFKDLDIGVMSDISGGQVRVLKGRTYLEILSLSEKAPQNLLLALASGLTQNIPVEKTTQRTAVDLLPKEGRVRGALILNRENTYGLARLTDIFSATYHQGQDEYDLLVRKITPSEGRKMISAVAEEIREFDGKIIQNNPDSLTAEFMGKTLILNLHGNFMIGIYASMPVQQAQQRLENWIETMKDQSHGPGR
jgi:hypothetical protein